MSVMGRMWLPGNVVGIKYLPFQQLMFCCFQENKLAMLGGGTLKDRNELDYSWLHSLKIISVVIDIMFAFKSPSWGTRRTLEQWLSWVGLLHRKSPSTQDFVTCVFEWIPVGSCILKLQKRVCEDSRKPITLWVCYHLIILLAIKWYQIFKCCILLDEAQLFLCYSQ